MTSQQARLGMQRALTGVMFAVVGCVMSSAVMAAQLTNTGSAQEDCDCLLAAAWQQIFEDKVAEILNQLL